MTAFYSTNGVDKTIAPFLPEFGYAVEVGAGEGVAGSNGKHFEDKGWLVMCVEANPNLEADGRKTRKLWRSVATGAKTEHDKQFALVWNYPYGSFSGFHTHEVPPNLNCPDLSTQPSITVEVRTLDEILEGSGFPRLDYLCVDVEGHELATFRGLDLAKWRPKIIVAEAWDEKNRKAICEHLSPFSYQLDMVLEYDCIFTRTEP